MYEARVLPFWPLVCCRKFHCDTIETLRTAIKEERGKPPTAKERGQRRVGKARQQFCHFVGIPKTDKMTDLERRFAAPISGQGEQVSSVHNLNRAISPVEWENFWYFCFGTKVQIKGRHTAVCLLHNIQKILIDHPKVCPFFIQLQSCRFLL